MFKTPDAKNVHLETDTMLKLANSIEGKVNIIIDVNHFEKPSVEVRIAIQKAMENDKFGKRGTCS